MKPATARLALRRECRGSANVQTSITTVISPRNRSSLQRRRAKRGREPVEEVGEEDEHRDQEPQRDLFPGLVGFSGQGLGPTSTTNASDTKASAAQRPARPPPRRQLEERDDRDPVNSARFRYSTELDQSAHATADTL